MRLLLLLTFYFNLIQKDFTIQELRACFRCVVNDTNSCRESKDLWTDKNTRQQQASLIASALYPACARNGFIYKNSSDVLQDKLILTLMSIMMRDQRYVLWSWSMPPWILGNLSFGPSAVMCDRICYVNEKVLSIALSPFLVLLLFFYWEIKSMRWCPLRHAGLMMKERTLPRLSCAVRYVCKRECMSVCASASNPATNTVFARAHVRC